MFSKLNLFAFTFAFICFSSKANAQYTTQDSSNFWSKVRFGGNLGIGFGNDSFSGFIAPAAIYQFNPQFGLGVSINFGYAQEDNDRFNASAESFNYGGSIISLYNPIPQIQLSAEFEEMGVSETIKINNEEFKDNYWYPALFLGAAYQIQRIGIGVRYDIIYDEDRSIYGSALQPFIRVLF